MYKIIRPDSHEEWLKYRASGIGSSEVGTLLGLNPYETPYQLWMRKTGKTPAKPENMAMKLGHYMESTVAQLYSDKTGACIDKDSEGDWLAVDEEKEYLRVSPDRFFTPQDSTEVGILECKTTQKTIDADEPPMYWYAQLQYQLAVTRITHGALAWLTAGRDFGHREFERNDDYCKYMLERIEEFWRKNICEGIEPEATTVADMAIKFPRPEEGKSVIADAPTQETLIQLGFLRDEIKQLETRKADLETIVKAAIADAEVLTDSEGKTLATFKLSKGSTTFDKTAFSKAYPDLYNSFTKQTAGSRRLLIK